MEFHMSVYGWGCLKWQLELDMDKVEMVNGGITLGHGES